MSSSLGYCHAIYKAFSVGKRGSALSLACDLVKNGCVDES